MCHCNRLWLLISPRIQARDVIASPFTGSLQIRGLVMVRILFLFLEDF